MANVTMTYASAIRETLKQEMRNNKEILLLGEDIGAYGGVYRITYSLLDEFGKGRLIDTPISEEGILGLGVGAALMGMRPVVEIMFMDFLQLALEPLVTEAAKARFLSGGKLQVPLIVRTQYGLGSASGPQHSQFFPSWFMQVPGLNVVLPSTPADAMGLLRTSFRVNSPVLFIESSALYNSNGEVPEEYYQIDFGKADIKRKGRDLTMVAISRVVPKALAAAEELSKGGIEAEVLDPRTLSPLDKDTMISSVKSTKRLLIVSDDYTVGGIGAALS